MNLSKYKWVVSTILAILALVVPIVIYMATLTEKTLTYEVKSKSELLGEQYSIDDLNITIKGEPVNEATIHTLNIKNTGSVPIRKNDFERAIFIKFKKKY